MKYLKLALIPFMLLVACGTTAEDLAITMVVQTEESLAMANTDTTQTAIANATSTQEMVFAEETNVVKATETKIVALTATAQWQLDAQATYAADRELKATEAAQPFFNLVESLYNKGYITTMGGEYVSLPDFSESESKIDYFYPYQIEYSPSNFIITTNVTWDSASDKANWWNSGCGFLFRIDEDFESFYAMFLTLDGYVRLERWVNLGASTLALTYYGKLDVPSGKASLTLVVENEDIHIFVNEKHVVSRSDTRFQSGYFAYTLSSGTNAGFGTSCEFRETNLWLFEGEAGPISGGNNGN